MTRLPLIVGFGGIGPAGRSSFHHAYKRLVFESLPNNSYHETFLGLATMMNLVSYQNGHYRDDRGTTYQPSEVVSRFKERILEGTLVRKIEIDHFDCDQVDWHKKVSLQAPGSEALVFITDRKQLPQPIPTNWKIKPVDKAHLVRVSIQGKADFLVNSQREMAAQAAGQLPTGFTPETQYNARSHPRGLQMAIIAASDAIHSIGIPWKEIVDAVKPDEISVYAGSVMSQLDENGYGGLMTSRLKGQRVSAKHLALGLNTMPADFINAYVLGNVGVTGNSTGACASFLYNLRNGMQDIQSGRSRVVIVGNSEAPLTPEIFDGYNAMGALANNEKLAAIQGLDKADAHKIDHRLASQPFGNNCGFTLSESAQFVVLMDDKLAMDIGAQNHGAISDVFINADGTKKSISAPGPGNYITMAKAVASAVSLVGIDTVRNRSMVMAHGSSTPQNRVSESKLLDKVATAFDIRQWPVSAVKSYLGHSLSPASADQLVSVLGTFKYGIIPGIKTVESFAEDLHANRLHLSNRDVQRSPGNIELAFLNSKGFGGNNASACILSPDLVNKMLSKRYGSDSLDRFLSRQRKTNFYANEYDQCAIKGDMQTIYRFGEDMIDEDQIEITAESLSLPTFKHSIKLGAENKYADMF